MDACHTVAVSFECRFDENVKLPAAGTSFVVEGRASNGFWHVYARLEFDGTTAPHRATWGDVVVKDFEPYKGEMIQQAGFLAGGGDLAIDLTQAEAGRYTREHDECMGYTWTRAKPESCYCKVKGTGFAPSEDWGAAVKEGLEAPDRG
mmetsp:Transcript_79555/g.227137  ORF Transcript_79555/g.227137 Transcript_79555/m.227137 type:complete len:148 (+) Transcript_79555:760-1203(+)